MAAMNPLYFLGWCAFRAAFKFYFGWRVYNPERVPVTGPVILASNHASFVDPPLVGSGLKRGIEGHTRSAAGRRRDYSFSGRHAHARRELAARPFRHWFDGDQIHRAGSAGPRLWHFCRVRPAHAPAASAPGRRQIRPSAGFPRTSCRSQDLLQAAPQGNLSTSGRRDHGGDC